MSLISLWLVEFFEVKGGLISDGDVGMVVLFSLMILDAIFDSTGGVRLESSGL